MPLSPYNQETAVFIGTLLYITLMFSYFLISIFYPYINEYLSMRYTLNMLMYENMALKSLFLSL